jgi:hypothetical protein
MHTQTHYPIRLLPRGYKPNRLARNRLARKPNRLFGPARPGPELTIYEAESYPLEIRHIERALEA